ncbi:MAG: ABC transporter permease [Dictyoglomi bacterium]|nr:ABC transporter permease [Dictyoglomota bacterium]HHV81248.1 ABC transporter permease [bacterium]
MYRYILRRLLIMIPVIIGVSAVVFFLIRSIPGDPALILLGEHSSEEAVAKIREQLGLDKPKIVQFFYFLLNVAKGDFGRSFTTNEFVVIEIAKHFPATIELTVCSMIFGSIVGLVLGVTAATYRNSIIDYLTTVISVTGISMPVFWLGLMAIILFSIKLPIFPISGRLDPTITFSGRTGLIILDSLLQGNFAVFKDAIHHIFLPALCLGTIPLASIARMTRSSMLEVLNQDFIRTAKAKGLPSRKVIYTHALRNALIPVVTVMGLQFGSLLGGAVLTETIFAWPGIGRLSVEAIDARNYPVIQGCIIFFAFIFVIINLLVDILYAFIDPRIRYE